jgi:hypothetical protein
MRHVHSSVVWLDNDRPELVRHPDTGRVVAFADAGTAFAASVALGVAGYSSPGTVTTPLDEVVHLIEDAVAASDLVGTLVAAMELHLTGEREREEQSVLDVLAAAGPRGASHEQFVEAGLAPGYIAVLRRLVDERGIQVKVDFTSGAARWALPARELRAA